MVFWPALIPYKILLYAVKARALKKQSCRTILNKDEVWLCEEPRGVAWHQSSSGTMPLEDAVDGSTSQIHATSNSTLPYALMGKCKHFMTYTYKGWAGHYQNNQSELKKRYAIVDSILPQFKGRFGEMTT